MHKTYKSSQMNVCLIKKANSYSVLYCLLCLWLYYDNKEHNKNNVFLFFVMVWHKNTLYRC